MVRLDDLGSTNTPLVNGKSAKHATLQVGDTIQLGDYVFAVAQAESLNAYLTSQSDEPTPATVSLSQVRYVRDDAFNTTAPGQLRTMDEVHDLFALSRRFSRHEGVADLLESLESAVRDKLAPGEIWIVRFLKDTEELVFYTTDKSSPQHDAPVEALRRSGAEHAGFLIPRIIRSDDGTRLESTLVAPFTVGDRALGAVAVRGHTPKSAYEEADLEYLIAMAHTFAPFLRAAEQSEQLRRDYQHVTGTKDSSVQLIGESEPMKVVRQQIKRAAKTRLQVLLIGETGTGKELAARTIHDLSPRSDGPYVVVNCAAIPSELFESEMFGHAKGAFTGASKPKPGRFEEAHGGTLFLDEIGELRQEHQASLLRAIELGSLDRVGGKQIVVDVRVVAATNRDPDSSALRPDLLHRLSGFRIAMPPLRDRLEDIPELVDHILAGLQRDRPGIRIKSSAIKRLMSWHWPGNVRELRACIERAAALADGDSIEPDDILIGGPESTSSEEPTPLTTLAEAEKHHILRVLKHHDGCVRAAARSLKIARSTLHAKLRAYGIEASDAEASEAAP